ncbi:MAG: histidine--tRNA ligase, partial [Planctomycetota bacterium]|nr:histidine--tRNA ligase [Planctomycetota bacterium]
DPIATGKQMAYGSSRGHRFGLIVGPEEAEAQTFRLRDLATRKELKAIAWVNLESSVAEALQFQPTSPS